MSTATTVAVSICGIIYALVLRCVRPVPVVRYVVLLVSRVSLRYFQVVRARVLSRIYIVIRGGLVLRSVRQSCGRGVLAVVKSRV